MSPSVLSCLSHFYKYDCRFTPDQPPSLISLSIFSRQPDLRPSFSINIPFGVLQQFRHFLLLLLHGVWIFSSFSQRGYSSLWCLGFWSRTRASEIAARGLGSWFTGAQLLRSMWILPWSVIKPTCTALADAFLTTVPIGKSRHFLKIVKGKIIAQQEKAFQGESAKTHGTVEMELLHSNIPGTCRPCCLESAMWQIHWLHPNLKMILSTKMEIDGAPPISGWTQNTEVNKEKTQMTESENA